MKKVLVLYDRVDKFQYHVGNFLDGLMLKHKVIVKTQSSTQIEILGHHILFLTITNPDKLRGINADEIDFKFTPDDELITIAKMRVMANNGRVFVHGELI